MCSLYSTYRFGSVNISSRLVSPMWKMHTILPGNAPSFIMLFLIYLSRLLAQTTLRNILGTKNLHEILSDRESISSSMQVPLLYCTYQFGDERERRVEQNVEENTIPWWWPARDIKVHTKYFY